MQGARALAAAVLMAAAGSEGRVASDRTDPGRLGDSVTQPRQHLQLLLPGVVQRACASCPDLDTGCHVNWLSFLTPPCSR